MSVFVLPLDSLDADLQLAGGKAESLSKLARAGFQVPGGFLLTTLAYEAFVQASGLADVISSAVISIREGQAQGFQAASQSVRKAFEQAELPSPLAEAICMAYRSLGSPAVAVRSSATCEDLPGASFAGQIASTSRA